VDQLSFPFIRPAPRLVPTTMACVLPFNTTEEGQGRRRSRIRKLHGRRDKEEDVYHFTSALIIHNRVDAGSAGSLFDAV